MEFIFTLLITIAFLICLFVYNKDSEKAGTRLIRIFYIINTLCLLSSCLVHYNERLPQGAGLEDGPLLWLYIPLAFPFLINWVLRIAFLPYIYFAVLTGIYIKDLKKNRFPKKETILFIIMLLLSILGLVYMEIESQSMWQAVSSV